MIIGIAGTLGAGKGTVVSYLKKNGFSHYSSSDILRGILRERGLPETRTYMSPLANELQTKYPGGVLQVSHERAQQEGVKNYILESIHRQTEADFVRSVGGVLLGIDADLHKRYERSVGRADGEKDNVTFQEFVEHSRREDDGEGESGPNIRAVLSTADIILLNNGTPKELQAQIDLALKQLHHTP